MRNVGCGLLFSSELGRLFKLNAPKRVERFMKKCVQLRSNLMAACNYQNGKNKTGRLRQSTNAETPGGAKRKLYRNGNIVSCRSFYFVVKLLIN